MNTWEKIYSASIEDLKKGYTEDEGGFVCLFCGEAAEKGVVYPEGEKFLEAERYMRLHIEKAHGSVFEFLINLDKKFTGISDHQNRLLRLFYEGKSDEEVKSEMDIGSIATIRNHRFILKEKEKQARVFLVLMDILKNRDKRSCGSCGGVENSEKSPRDEREKVLKKYFPQGTKGPLSHFSMKQKFKLIILEEIVKKFEKGKIYTEKEVNGILTHIFEDYATIRRYLIEYKFMDRKVDGSQYWLR